MAINRDKPDLWKTDIVRSVDFYNDWFMNFAPQAFRETRIITAARVEAALISTNNLTIISPSLLKEHPGVLPILRMSTCPPIARDRLIGLAGISKNLVECMENEDNPRVPPRMSRERLDHELSKISAIIERMADPDIFVWLGRDSEATADERQRAATIVADRLCGAVSNPIIRNAQEKRQLESIANYLNQKGYHNVSIGTGVRYDQLSPGEYSFHTNIPVNVANSDTSSLTVNIPVDVVIMPLSASAESFPLLIEAKSAGDFANVNKRRKEEAHKMKQLRDTYGADVRYGLFLCGYFDSGYLGYEAAEGIDWVWEHRIEDLDQYDL
jgi:hypothetical protein